MKISRLAAAALMAGIGLVGMTGQASAADAAIVGSWTLTTDFNCDGTITGPPFTITFNADGTWTSSLPQVGRWLQVGGVMTFNVTDNPGLQYAGNVSGLWVSGVQGFLTTGGVTGCWGGHVQGIPSAAAANSLVGAVNPLTGS